MTKTPILIPSRRDLLAGAGAFTAWNAIPTLATGAPVKDPRLMVVVLLGGMDGLGAVAPIGDPDYKSARNGLLLPESGPDAALALDSTFSLNPRMPAIHKLFGKKQATIYHAIASPYRRRSHFDGQDVLQSGYDRPGQTRSGWLNRAISGMSAHRLQTSGLAIAPRVPLILRGEAPVSTWLPTGFSDANEDTRDRLLELYGQTDPSLEDRLASALAIGRTVADGKAGMRSGGRGSGKGRSSRVYRALATAASRILNKDDGPRIGVLTVNGWDTHARQKPITGRLGRQLGHLDTVIDTIAVEMAEHWAQTTVLVITEFGRMVRMNGTEGTDHGTATAAMVFGGSVNGGRVVSDWPGLAERDLHEGRDLKPTLDLRGLCKGILAEQFSIPEAVLAEKVFPESRNVKPFQNVLRL